MYMCAHVRSQRRPVAVQPAAEPTTSPKRSAGEVLQKLSIEAQSSDDIARVGQQYVPESPSSGPGHAEPKKFGTSCKVDDLRQRHLPKQPASALCTIMNSLLGLIPARACFSPR